MWKSHEHIRLVRLPVLLMEPRPAVFLRSLARSRDRQEEEMSFSDESHNKIRINYNVLKYISPLHPETLIAKPHCEWLDLYQS